VGSEIRFTIAVVKDESGRWLAWLPGLSTLEVCRESRDDAVHKAKLFALRRLYERVLADSDALADDASVVFETVDP
jgi:hypothetical protein